MKGVLTQAGLAMNDAVIARLQALPDHPQVQSADMGDDFCWPPYIAEKVFGDSTTKVVIVTENRYGVATVIAKLGTLEVDQIPHLLSTEDEESGLVVLAIPRHAIANVLQALR